MKIKLYVLSCEECESEHIISTSKDECPNCGATDGITWSLAKIDDYVQEWGNDLENANRHSLTDMPDIIYSTLKKHIKDKVVLEKIILEFYEMHLGVD